MAALVNSGAVTIRVGNVFGMRAPNEVFDAVVAGVAVKVATLHAFRPRPNKRLKNHAVHKTYDLPALSIDNASCKSDAQISSLISCGRQQVPLVSTPTGLTETASDQPIVANLVAPFESRNILEYNDFAGIRHDCLIPLH
jgi:hypothetical protein